MTNFIYRIPCRLAHIDWIVDWIVGLDRWLGSLVWVVGCSLIDRWLGRWLVIDLEAGAFGKKIGSSNKESTACRRLYKAMLFQWGIRV